LSCEYSRSDVERFERTEVKRTNVKWTDGDTEDCTTVHIHQRWELSDWPGRRRFLMNITEFITVGAGQWPLWDDHAHTMANFDCFKRWYAKDANGWVLLATYM
jgi:hypothetical protein